MQTKLSSSHFKVVYFTKWPALQSRPNNNHLRILPSFLNESNLAGSFHSVSVSRQAAESLLQTVRSDEGVAAFNLDTVEGFDSLADLDLVSAGIADEDKSVVVFDATHGRFSVQGELDDRVSVSAGDNSNGSLADVLGLARQTQSARQTESGRSVDLASDLGIDSTEGSLTSTFSFNNSVCVVGCG